MATSKAKGKAKAKRDQTSKNGTFAPQGSTAGFPKADVPDGKDDMFSDDGPEAVTPVADTNAANFRKPASAKAENSSKPVSLKADTAEPKAAANSKFTSLKADTAEPKADAAEPKSKITSLKADTAEPKADAAEPKSKITSLKADTAEPKAATNSKFTSLKADTAEPKAETNSKITSLKADTAEPKAETNSKITSLKPDTANPTGADNAADSNPETDAAQPTGAANAAESNPEADADAAQPTGAANAAALLPVLFAVEQQPIKPELQPIAASVRQIVARQQFGVLPHRIAVVSALPGEGVTTISGVFSSVLSSDFGVQTCRVDLSSGSPSKRGLVDVVTGNDSLDDVLEWQGHAATLSSGAVAPSDRHRLARSEELDRLMNDLSRRFHHVILDLPSVLSDSEGLAMMRFADAYVLVVKHGVTTLQQVQTATEQLSDTEVLGSVINNVRTRTPRLLTRWLEG